VAVFPSIVISTVSVKVQEESLSLNIPPPNSHSDALYPVSAGVYLYSIEAGEFRQTKKMILLK